MNIPERSLPNYIQALNEVFLLDHIPAWSNNSLKRTIGKPKIVFRDAGLAARLSGIDAISIQESFVSSLMGGLVENFVASELAKQQSWSNIEYKLYHFRDRDGKEVDLILENAQRRIVGIEVKASSSLSRKDFTALDYLKDKIGDQFQAGFVFYLGSEIQRFSPGLWALPLACLWRQPVIP